MRGSTVFGVVLGAALLISFINSLSGRGENLREGRGEVEQGAENVSVEDVRVEPQDSDGLASETRNVGAFDAVSLLGVGDVTVSLGAEPSVVVRAPKHLLRELRTRTEGGVLKLETERQTRLLGGRISGNRVSYDIITPELEGLELSGAGDVRAERVEGDEVTLTLSGSGSLYVEDLRADELEVSLSGEGDMQLAGSVSEQRVTVSGVGSYRACGLESEDAEVGVSGVGDALVWATDTLDAAVSGVGSVRYRDEPEVSAEVSGLGSVARSGRCG